MNPTKPEGKTNFQVVPPTGMEFLPTLDVKHRTHILNSKQSTYSFTSFWELSPDEVERVKNGETIIQITCIGMQVPILVGIDDPNLNEFINNFKPNQK